MTQTHESSAPESWKPSYRAKLITDALIVAFSAGYTFLASELGLGDSSRPGPGFFPLLVGMVLILAAGLHLVALVVRRPRVPTDAGSGRPSIHAGLMLAALAVYLVALPYLGHPLAATIMSAAVLKLLGTRRTWVILATALTIGLLSDLLFTVVLGIALPEGSLGLGWAAWT